MLLYEQHKVHKFGSVEESIAIHMANRLRSARVMEPLFAAVNPDKVSQLFRQYKGILFPEDKYDDLEYIRKARRIFDKLKNVVLTATPIRPKKRHHSK